MRAGGDRERLAACFGPEGWRSNIRNPNLYRSQTLGTKAVAMVLHLYA